MSQKNNYVNFLIQDTNGQPKMVKVVQNVPKQQQMKIKQSPMKMLKLPIIDNNTQRPVFQSVKVSGGVNGVPKVVQIPIQTLKQLQNPSIEIATPVPEKHIKLEPEPYNDHDNEEVTSDSSQNNITVESTSSSSFSMNISNTAPHTTKRRSMTEDVPEYTTKRRKHADKVGKGLRHFSMKVCEKVRNKGFTSYNEVADELVSEFAAGMHGSTDNQQYDQKNIRRRVYDALNVLMAMNIISKEKKEIRWLGLPTNSVQECTALEHEKRTKIQRLQDKTQQLHELILRLVSFKNLIERNNESENKGINPSTASAILLPFIVVNTNEDAVIQCSISSDKTEYMFNFDKTFYINDDVEILKRMGLHYGLDSGKCSQADIEKALRLIPKSLESFVEEMGRGLEMNLSNLYTDEEILDEEDEDDDLDDDGTEAGGDDDSSSEDSSDLDV